MKTLNKLFYREFVFTIALVCIGFLSLFYFFDIVNELQAVHNVGGLGYTLPRAFLVVLLLIPSHLYELLPIALLIGTVFVMSRMAKSSEFTVLRMSGLTPGRALSKLLLMGAIFSVLTFVVGDYVAPYSNKASQMLKAKFEGDTSIGTTSAWLKEKQKQYHYAINIGSLSPDGEMKNISIYQFSNEGTLTKIIDSQTGVFDKTSQWILLHGKVTSFVVENGRVDKIVRAPFDRLLWSTSINAAMLSAAVLKPDHMNTLELFTYMQHLKHNEQSAQRYEIQFWKKFFYPLSCLVMVVLALPFAYLHFRRGNIATYVFIGIMVGISFVLLNNVTNDLGWMQNWTPWISAALPSLIYSVFSLAAFFWMVFRR